MRFKGNLIFVRHGETDWNATERIQGRKDIPMNARGHGQAREVGRQLRADGINVGIILTSSLARAEQTARILAGAIGLSENRLFVDERMTECAFGRLEGMTRDEVETEHPGLIWYVHGAPYDFAPFGGEHRDQVIARQVEAIEHYAYLIEGVKREALLLVGHGRALGSLQSHLGMPRQLLQGTYFSYFFP